MLKDLKQTLRAAPWYPGLPSRDLGLEIVKVMQAHGQEPSASEMIELVNTIKETVPGPFTRALILDKVAKTLGTETGVPVDVLDPGATGPDDASLDYYETVMRNNIKVLEPSGRNKLSKDSKVSRYRGVRGRHGSFIWKYHP